jgi:hypothetical protein
MLAKLALLGKPPFIARVGGLWQSPHPVIARAAGPWQSRGWFRLLRRFEGLRRLLVLARYEKKA